MNKKIGIFDSGVGGLTVLKGLIKILPNEDYIYIGDNKNCPYGDKTKEELYNYATTIINYFIKCNVKLIIVACNTISSILLDDLQKDYPNIKFIGVISSTIRKVLEIKPKKLLIIGTKQTIESNIYEKRIKEANKIVDIFNLKAPLLVPLIESKSQNIEETLKNYLNCGFEFDTILLGCTHYELLNKIILKNYNVNIVSSSNCVLTDVYNYLTKNNILGSYKGVSIFTTGDVNNFYKISKNIIKEKVKFLNLEVL